MRTAQRNKQTVWYALYKGVTAIKDTANNYTGEEEVEYYSPVKARMNVSGSKGRAEVEQVGIDAPFTKAAVTDDLTTPFDTTTVFWIGKEPTVNGSATTPNYRCTGVVRTINSCTIALKEVERS